MTDNRTETRKQHDANLAAFMAGGISEDEYFERVEAHINAEIAKAKLEAFDVAFDCHDYDRLRAYRAKLLKEVK